MYPDPKSKYTIVFLMSDVQDIPAELETALYEK